MIDREPGLAPEAPVATKPVTSEPEKTQEESAPIPWDDGIIFHGTFEDRAEWFAFADPDGQPVEGPGGFHRVDLVIENGHYVGARYANANGRPARVHGVPDPDRQPFVAEELQLGTHAAPEPDAAWSGWFAQRDASNRMTALHLNYKERPVDPVDPGWCVMRIEYDSRGIGSQQYFDSANNRAPPR